MTFEFLKEKYPKEGLVVVHSLTELNAVYQEYMKQVKPRDKLLILIPIECIELVETGARTKDVRLGMIDYYSGFTDIDVFILMSRSRYRRGVPKYFLQTDRERLRKQNEYEDKILNLEEDLRNQNSGYRADLDLIIEEKDKSLMRVNQELEDMKERWRNMTYKYRRSRDLGYFLLAVVVSAIWAMLIIGSG